MKTLTIRGAKELVFTNCSLMCFQEMYVKGSLVKCIRVIILFNSNKEQIQLQHIYFKKATLLRSNLITSENE